MRTLARTLLLYSLAQFAVTDKRADGAGDGLALGDGEPLGLAVGLGSALGDGDGSCATLLEAGLVAWLAIAMLAIEPLNNVAIVARIVMTRNANAC
jgi:hypothetical protein